MGVWGYHPPKLKVHLSQDGEGQTHGVPKSCEITWPGCAKVTTGRAWESTHVRQAKLEVGSSEWPADGARNIQMALEGKKAPHPWIVKEIV